MSTYGPFISKNWRRVLRQINLQKQIMDGAQDNLSSLLNYYKAKIIPVKWNKGMGMKAVSFRHVWQKRKKTLRQTYWVRL